ncbi:MAG: hypothetical protein BWK80_56555 [Desulfobacteraceae bacterium IS3]|jgi:uncharacterized protein YceK|nr:MAG: hypothetical protein BWK80_56555 [Desulfobacteraceae bacterium IS3]HAO21553.1 hypothetical protein [Desulfobacteraceae bacterium]
MKSEILIIFICLLMSGCGYRFSEATRLPGGIRHISVATLENRSGETGAESIITNDLIYEMSRNGIHGQSDTADAFLSGVIRSVSIDSVSHRGINTSLQRRIRLTIDLSLKDASGKILWSKNGVSANEAYNVMSDKSATEWNKRAAISVLSKRLAENAYHQLTDNF